MSLFHTNYHVCNKYLDLFVRFQHDLKPWQMSKMSSKWAHWTQSKLCLVTQLFPFPEEKEQRPTVEKKKNGTYFLPCGQWLNCKGMGEANIRGRPLDFWGGGGGMGNFRKKNPTDWFRGKKYLVRRYLRKKISCTEKKYLSWHINYAAKKNVTPLYVRGKNSRGLGKQVLTQTKSPIPPSEGKLSTPELGLCHSHFFSSF